VATRQLVKQINVTYKKLIKHIVLIKKKGVRHIINLATHSPWQLIGPTFKNKIEIPHRQNSSKIQSHRGNIDISNTYIYMIDHSSSLVQCIQIISGGVKLVLRTETSPHSGIMRSLQVFSTG
jgi:hypothetical protein